MFSDSPEETQQMRLRPRNVGPSHILAGTSDPPQIKFLAIPPPSQKYSAPSCSTTIESTVTARHYVYVTWQAPLNTMSTSLDRQNAIIMPQGKDWSALGTKCMQLYLKTKCISSKVLQVISLISP